MPVPVSPFQPILSQARNDCGTQSPLDVRNLFTRARYGFNPEQLLEYESYIRVNPIVYYFYFDETDPAVQNPKMPDPFFRWPGFYASYNARLNVLNTTGATGQWTIYLFGNNGFGDFSLNTGFGGYPANGEGTTLVASSALGPVRDFGFGIQVYTSGGQKKLPCQLILYGVDQ